jgi:tryptophan synthase alpha chain
MNRLENTFAKLKADGRKAFITFTMAGDPDAGKSVEILHELAASGADVLEIGVPFTDPMADGPAVQAAGLRALNGGMTLNGVFEIVQQFRSKNNDTPIVLMGYFNPILRYGIDKFINDCNKFGVDGLIIVDIPPEEAEEILPQAQQNNLSFIRLLTPTTDEKRLGKILPQASGFLYYVSIAGVTGTKTADASAVEAHILNIRKSTDLPIVVGFGIKTPADAAQFAAFADGVVVGSAIVQNIEQNQNDKELISLVSTQVKALRTAV